MQKLVIMDLFCHSPLDETWVVGPQASRHVRNEQDRKGRRPDLEVEWQMQARERSRCRKNNIHSSYRGVVDACTLAVKAKEFL